jgi:hypothetical protein
VIVRSFHYVGVKIATIVYVDKSNKKIQNACLACLAQFRHHQNFAVTKCVNTMCSFLHSVLCVVVPFIFSVDTFECHFIALVLVKKERKKKITRVVSLSLSFPQTTPLEASFYQSTATATANIITSTFAPHKKVLQHTHTHTHTHTHICILIQIYKHEFS